MATLCITCYNIKVFYILPRGVFTNMRFLLLFSRINTNYFHKRNLHFGFQTHWVFISCEVESDTLSVIYMKFTSSSVIFVLVLFYSKYHLRQNENTKRHVRFYITYAYSEESYGNKDILVDKCNTIITSYSTL